MLLQPLSSTWHPGDRFHHFGSFINDHDLGPCSRHPDHFADSLGWVIESIDPADVENCIERLITQRQFFSIAQNQLCF